MIIKRKKSSVYYNVLIGIAITSLITFATLEDGGGFELHYIFFCFLAVYDFTMAIYNWKTPLITLGEDVITFYSFPSKKSIYQTKDLTIKYSAGDYVFMTETNNIYRITKSNIPKDQLLDFEERINNLINKTTEINNLVTV